MTTLTPPTREEIEKDRLFYVYVRHAMEAVNVTLACSNESNNQMKVVGNGEDS
jgi:hypothetical protein